MHTFYMNVTDMERIFYQGRCLQAIMPGVDGSFGIMANHENAVAAIVPGELRIQKEDGTWLTAVCGTGFAEIMNNRVMMLADTVEYPEELDKKRAERAKERAQEQLRQKKSIEEYRMNQANLARAMARLKAISKYNIGK